MVDTPSIETIGMFMPRSILCGMLDMGWQKLVVQRVAKTGAYGVKLRRGFRHIELSHLDLLRWFSPQKNCAERPVRFFAGLKYVLPYPAATQYYNTLQQKWPFLHPLSAEMDTHFSFCD